MLDGGESHTNVVTITAVDDGGIQATDADRHTITGTDIAPTITVVKTGPETISEGGQDVTWSFSIHQYDCLDRPHDGPRSSTTSRAI